MDRILEGIRRLDKLGYLPIVTITRTWEGADEEALAGFSRLLSDIGYDDVPVQ